MGLKSNIGDSGPTSSIRIGGRRIEELSVVERMQARGQVELSEEEQRKKGILDKYPPYRVPNMEAAIREAGENIKRFEDAISKERKTIADFTGHLALCKQRDIELKAAGFDLL